MEAFSGLGVHLGNLSWLSPARSRSISAENFTGEAGRGGMAVEGTGAVAARGLGQGWKISPSVAIEPGETFILADIKGPGAIQQMWMAQMFGKWRHAIIRIYWDDQEQPSVECPIGDFFANGWETYARVSSLAVCVNPGRAFNCYWEMPFRRRARVTIENIGEARFLLYYQINYVLTDVPAAAAYFHAQFRRTNPVPYKSDHTILDGVKGAGQYVGTYMARGANNAGWWGEGEIKFFIDGDADFPTICGTGTEDSPGLCGIQQPLCRTAPGDPARRSLSIATALRPLSLAHPRSRPLFQRPSRDHSDARLAHAPRKPLSAAAGRHRHRGFLVPDPARGPVPAPAR